VGWSGVGPAGRAVVVIDPSDLFMSYIGLQVHRDFSERVVSGNAVRCREVLMDDACWVLRRVNLDPNSVEVLEGR
jgi:hypothetical protein